VPLFVCARCGHVDNTALGHYWDLRGPGGVAAEPLCTQCRTGAWHGRFPRRTAEDYAREWPDEPLLRREGTHGEAGPEAR